MNFVISWRTNTESSVTEGFGGAEYRGGFGEKRSSLRVLANGRTTAPEAGLIWRHFAAPLKRVP